MLKLNARGLLLNKRPKGKESLKLKNKGLLPRKKLGNKESQRWRQKSCSSKSRSETFSAN